MKINLKWIQIRSKMNLDSKMYYIFWLSYPISTKKKSILMQFVTLTKEFLHIQSIEKVFLLNSEKGDLFYALCAFSL